MVKSIKICIVFIALILSACAGNLTGAKITDSDYSSLGLQAIAFGRIDGLSDDALQKMQQAIVNVANSYGFSIGNYEKNIILQGYFSFEDNEQNNKIVYYVFDLLDKKGQRLHRVNGRLRLVANANNILQDEDYKEISSVLFLALRQWRSQLNK